MARQRRRPALTHCKVSSTTHATAPWRVSWPVEGDGGKPRRIRKAFATESAAWSFAEGKEIEIANHGVRYGDIPPEARRAFDFYRDERVKLEADGIEVPRIESMIADALAELRRQHEEREARAITIADAVALFNNHKATRVGSGQAENIKGHLKRFAADFGTRPMRSITALEIETWLSSLRSRRNPAKLAEPPLVSATTRNAHRTTLVSFFKHGANPARAWCPMNPVTAIEPEKIKVTEPLAYSPKDAAKIMRAALALDSPLLPSLALEMFAGLRPSEVMALDLAAIDLAADDFRVPGVKPNGEETKTGSRTAPLLPAGKAWLAAQPRRAGLAFAGHKKARSNEMRRILAAAKVKAIHDGPRHSFITYRTAETRDVARVADECGNSPNVIAKHYRAIVSEAAATAFFAIRPEAEGENVVPMIAAS